MIRYIKKVCLFSMAVSSALGNCIASDCKVPLKVVPMTQTDDVPEAIEKGLCNRLIQILTESTTSAGEFETRFFIGGKFSHTYDNVLAGPPKQFAVNTTLTIYVGDAESQALYGSCSFDLKGVGSSKQRAMLNALRPINASNEELKALISKASDKVLEYYDANAGQILAKAKKAAATQNYEEALYYAFSIPECCNAYARAVDEGLQYYQEYIDVIGNKYYEQARSVWAASQNASSGSEALALLVNIPINSSAYPVAEKLVSEISSVVKDDKFFEKRTKYNDTVELRKMEINSAKEVGVSWGKGQQPETTNIAWIK